MIRLTFDNAAGVAKLTRSDGAAFDQDEGLETAVLLSLFTDRRADDDDDVPQDDKRGWWADAFAELPGDQIGSRLWQLRRRTLTGDTLRLAEQFAEEALGWMVRTGVAARVSTEASVLGPHVMLLDIKIYRPGDETSPWSHAWEVHVHGL